MQMMMLRYSSLHRLTFRVEFYSKLVNIDATICAERPKMNPYIPEMKACMAQVIGCDEDDISIKATTTEKLGFTGREEGISAYAVVLIEKA